MANITTLLKVKPEVATTRPQTIAMLNTTNRQFILDPDQMYTFQHTGLQSDGLAASTATVRLAFDGAAPSEADLSADIEDQCHLIPGIPVTVGPGVSSVDIKVTAEVLITLIPTEKQFRRW